MITPALDIGPRLNKKYRHVLEDWRMIPIIAALAKQAEAEHRADTNTKARADYLKRKSKDPVGFSARHNAKSKRANAVWRASGKEAEYYRKRRTSSPHNAAMYKYGRAIRQALQKTKKTSKVFEALVGCDIPTFRAHIESLFKDGMHWGNRGKKIGCWCVDHIRPLNTFRLDDPNERKLAYFFKNTQPLWVTENSSKGSMWEGQVHRKGMQS